MKRLSIIALFLLLALLALSACAAGSPTPVCPEPTDQTKLLSDDVHGYCLLYPASHDVFEPSSDETVLAMGSLLNVEQPRAYIKVAAAAGRTATQVADEVVADVLAALPGFEVQRSISTLDGEQAVILDNLPGQDINRRLLTVHGGRLYDLTFAPLGDAPAAAQTEALYASTVNSFRFLNGK